MCRFRCSFFVPRPDDDDDDDDDITYDFMFKIFFLPLCPLLSLGKKHFLSKLPAGRPVWATLVARTADPLKSQSCTAHSGSPDTGVTRSAPQLHAPNGAPDLNDGLGGEHEHGE